jgi:hypothetical protein
MSHEKFGSISFSAGKESIAAVKYDRIAVDSHGKLMLVSLVADGVRIKAIRAMLSGTVGKAHANASGGMIRRPTDPQWRYGEHPGRLEPTEGGYNTWVHKLDYGQYHVLFITRQPGFMPVVNDEAIWRELNADRFTTPILKEWMPWIDKKLRGKGVLEDARSFNAHCGILGAVVADLDEIVSSGLKDGHISIPGLEAASSEPAASVEPTNFEYGDNVSWTTPHGEIHEGVFRYYEEHGEASVTRMEAAPGGVPIGRVLRIKEHQLLPRSKS